MISAPTVVREVGSLTPAKFWRAVRRPSMIPVRLAAPPPLAVERAVPALWPETAPQAAAEFRAAYAGHSRFFEEINQCMMAVRGHPAAAAPWYEFLYVAIRCAAPRLILETGVFDGYSSAVMLKALDENGAGELISIDLPAVTTIQGSTHGMPDTALPPGHQPGWLIPNRLRGRHTLMLGESRAVLPTALVRAPRIDFFLHDSLHTHAHQSYEYAAVWPHLAEGGVLASDDIFWSPAFHQFCRAQRRPYVSLEAEGRVLGFGAVRK
ncbi:MAG: class I SAM-dependent methyltransferase [Candidatus Omnitrophica bacterium]|nr:class I SAM-dependent methyltransferase [Candidatus Omnitrophota bacterium]